MENKVDFMNVAKDVVASVLGSMAQTYAGQPLDTIKVRMQGVHNEFRNPVDCFIKTVRKEGALSLW